MKTEELQKIPSLLEQIDSNDFNAQNNARRALFYLARDMWELDRVGKGAIPALVKALNAQNDMVRIGAIWGLNYLAQHKFDDHELQNLAVNALINTLDDEHMNIRLFAVETLYWFKDAHAVSALLKRLNDEYTTVAVEATKVLGFIKDISAVPTLLETLRNTTKSLLRHAICVALGEIGDTRAVPALIDLFHSTDRWRRVAATALGEIGDRQATPILLEALRHDPNQEVREWIAFGLFRMKDPSAVPDLAIVLNEINERETTEIPWKLRETAAYALGEIGDIAALPALMQAIETAPEWQVVMSAVDAIPRITTPHHAATILFELLRHKTDHVRGFAARQLGYIATGTEDLELKNLIVSKLITCLSDAGISYYYGGNVAGEAARSLRFIGTPEAIAAFEQWKSQQQY